MLSPWYNKKKEKKNWSGTYCEERLNVTRRFNISLQQKCHHLSVWITVRSKSKCLQAGYDPRYVWCMETSFDCTDLSLQIKIHVMQMSDVQFVRHRYICAVILLNVDTRTAYCIRIYTTAFHRFKTGDDNLYRCWYGKKVKSELRSIIFTSGIPSARWYYVTVQFNWGGSFAHSSIKTNFDAFWVLDVELAGTAVEHM